HGQGKVTVHDISITKKSDRASPLLFQAAATGRHFPKVTLHVRKAGGDGYLTYVLEDVLVSSAHASSGGHRPTESVTLSFARTTTQSGMPGPVIDRAPALQPHPATSIPH